MGISSIYHQYNPFLLPSRVIKGGWEIPELDEGLVRWENHPTKYSPAGL